MKQQNEAFPSAIEAILLVVGLFIAEYLLAALLHDLRPLSGIDPSDLSGENVSWTGGADLLKIPGFLL